MTNHPNRKRPRLGVWPTKEQVINARAVSGLTQQAAADLVFRTLRAWQFWEAGDKPMPADTYELFLIKTGQK